MNRAVIVEFLTFVALAVALAAAEALISFEPERITDWRLWAVSLIGALVRQAAKSSLSWWAARKLVPRSNRGVVGPQLEALQRRAGDQTVKVVPRFRLDSHEQVPGAGLLWLPGLRRR